MKRVGEAAVVGPGRGAGGCSSPGEWAGSDSPLGITAGDRCALRGVEWGPIQASVPSFSNLLPTNWGKFK